MLSEAPATASPSWPPACFQRGLGRVQSPVRGRAERSKHHYFTAEPDQVGDGGRRFCAKRTRCPISKGAEAKGLKSGSFDDLAKASEAGKIKTLYVIERDLTQNIRGARLGPAVQRPASRSCRARTNTPSATAFTYRLPATAYVEEDGHFTNFEGK